MNPEPGLAEAAITTNLEQFLIVLSVSLGVATLSQIVSWLRQIPYTLLLVIVGLGLAFVDIRLVNLSPELILEIFLPPLLFEAAWNTRWRSLAENWLPITLFATIGVLIVIVGIAIPLSQFTSFSLATALLVGASLSSTDPVSVIALFRELGASKRLTILMNGESLFNDGVAVVSFVLLLGISLGSEAFSLPKTIASFVAVAGIGLIVGSLTGFGLSYLTQRFDSPLVEQSLTLVAAYGTYLITEELGGSGVIGEVTVGLILGNFGSRIGMSPRTRLLVSEFWEFLAFFVNSIVFLLIGDQIEITRLADNLWPIFLTILAVLVSRAVAIYGLSAISNWFSQEKITWAEQTALCWGGLRGSVSIALALSVPVLLSRRQDIIETVFGVVLFTLLVQGISTKSLLTSLNLIGDQPLRQEFAELSARRIALQRVINYLTKQENFGEFDPEFYRYQMELVKVELDKTVTKQEGLSREYPNLRSLSQEQLTKELLDIEADTYAELIRLGRLDSNLSPILAETLVKSLENQSPSD